MANIKQTGKGPRILGFVLCSILCSVYPAFSQTDSLRNKIVEDSLLRIADSLFRVADSMARQTQGTKQTVQGEQRRGTDYSDVVSWWDIVRQDSIARATKKEEPRIIHHPPHPLQQWYNRVLDSLRGVFNRTQSKMKTPSDSVNRDSLNFPRNKGKPQGDVFLKENEFLSSDWPNPTSYEKLVPNSPASPEPDTDFNALEDSAILFVYPPNVSGAAGLNRLMVTLNTEVRIQDRQGRAISTVSLESWWAPTGATSVFDPRILFDPYSRRWIFIACSNPRAANSSLLIAVSQTSDPTGPWYRHRIDADASNILWPTIPVWDSIRDGLV